MMYVKMEAHANHCQRMMVALNVLVCRDILDKGKKKMKIKYHATWFAVVVNENHS
jgi:hypothetical protein